MRMSGSGIISTRLVMVLIDSRPNPVWFWLRIWIGIWPSSWDRRLRVRSVADAGQDEFGAVVGPQHAGNLVAIDFDHLSVVLPGGDQDHALSGSGGGDPVQFPQRGSPAPIPPPGHDGDGGGDDRCHQHQQQHSHRQRHDRAKTQQRRSPWSASSSNLLAKTRLRHTRDPVDHLVASW